MKKPLVKPENIKVQDLALSVKTHKALRAVGMNTVQDLIDWKNQNGRFYKIRNVGTSAEGEILEAIKKYM